MTINCLIVEDEIAGQTILTKKLNTFFPECRINAIIDSKDGAIEYLKNNDVDLVFLDVHLKQGTGLEVLMSSEINFETVFITAHRDYAIDAINNGASYYLLKPIQDAEFKKGMDLVLERIKQKKSVSTILVTHKSAQIPIRVKDIFYFRSEGSYSHIYTENEQFLSSKSIGHYEQLLSTSMFIRTHHSFLVNIMHINRLLKGRNGVLIMNNGDEVPVSQRRINDLMEIFNS